MTFVSTAAWLSLLLPKSINGRRGREENVAFWYEMTETRKLKPKICLALKRKQRIFLNEHQMRKSEAIWSILRDAVRSAITYDVLFWYYWPCVALIGIDRFQLCRESIVRLQLSGPGTSNLLPLRSQDKPESPKCNLYNDRARWEERMSTQRS